MIQRPAVTLIEAAKALAVSCYTVRAYCLSGDLDRQVLNLKRGGFRTSGGVTMESLERLLPPGSGDPIRAPRLMTIPEAGEFIGRGATTTRKLMHAGELERYDLPSPTGKAPIVRVTTKSVLSVAGAA